MSYWLINIIFTLFIIYFLRVNRHGLHMFQLEHYYKDRYINWMKQNIKTVFNLKKIVLLVISSIVLLINKKIGAILTIITFLLLIITLPRKKEKKPFVITKRVKRQFLTYFILMILLGIIINVFNDVYSVILLNVISMISYLFVCIVALINSPVEKIINNSFCRKAKKKLNSITDLKVIGITRKFWKN